MQQFQLFDKLKSNKDYGLKFSVLNLKQNQNIKFLDKMPLMVEWYVNVLKNQKILNIIIVYVLNYYGAEV